MLLKEIMVPYLNWDVNTCNTFVSNWLNIQCFTYHANFHLLRNLASFLKMTTGQILCSIEWNVLLHCWTVSLKSSHCVQEQGRQVVLLLVLWPLKCFAKYICKTHNGLKSFMKKHYFFHKYIHLYFHEIFLMHF